MSNLNEDHTASAEAPARHLALVTNDHAPALRPAATPTRYTLHDSPLWACASEHSLWGRVVYDPREVAEIAARIARYGGAQ